MSPAARGSMRGIRVPIVGRDSELEAVRRFVAGLDDGPASFVLEGDAGIGKTAIWTAAVAAAELNSVAVRTCRCTESDAEWAFSGLGDLLDDLSSDSTRDLPEIQRQALAGALLMTDAPVGSPGVPDRSSAGGCRGRRNEASRRAARRGFRQHRNDAAHR